MFELTEMLEQISMKCICWQKSQIEEMRNRIVEANFKWRQAQLMVDYSYKQLDLAVAKWVEVATIDSA